MPEKVAIPHTVFQLAKLRHLLHKADFLLSLRERKKAEPNRVKRIQMRLGVLLALCEGGEDPRLLGISRPGLCKIRKEAETRGLDALITKAEQTIAHAEEKFAPSSGRRRPGRPPTSFSQWLAAQETEGEPIAEVVFMVLSSTVRFAVIGIRPGRGDKNTSGEQEAHATDKMVDAAWSGPELPDWASNGPGFYANYLFMSLRQAAGEMFKMPTEFPPGFVEDSRKLLENYSARWRFFVIHTGDDLPFPEIFEPFRQRLVRSAAVQDGGVIDELEGFIYRLRLRENLQGLFPVFLPGAGMAGEPEEDGYRIHPVIWRVTESTIKQALVRKCVEFYVLALSGVAFELPARVRKRIVHEERFPIGFPDFRPHVTVRDVSSPPGIGNLLGPKQPRTVAITYRPIPEFGFTVHQETGEELKEFAKDVRKRLSGPGRKPRFEYSVRVEKGHTSSAYPHALVRDLPEPETRQRIAVVSVPRQWFFEPPAVPLVSVPDLAAGVRKPVSSYPADFDAHGRRLLVFHAHSVLQAIRAAFEANRYGDRLLAFHKLDEDLEKALPKFHRRLLGSSPAFYFSPDELAGKNVDIRTLWRLTHCPIDYPLAGEFESGGRVRGTLYPGYNPEEVFKRLLSDYDADFLLREISDTAWEELNALSDKWRNICAELIHKHYFSGEEGDKLRGIAVSAGLKVDSLGSEELRDWGMEAISRYLEGARRVVRHAVETAQRLTTRGFRAEAIVVCTEDDVIRRWRSYLREYYLWRNIDRQDAEVAFNKVRKEVAPDVGSLNRQPLPFMPRD